MASEIAKVRDDLARAFSARPYPGDDKIAVTKAWLPEYEGNQVARYFKGKPWQDLSYGKLRTEYPADPTASVHFMRDEGFRYYLPAFASMALDLDPAGDIADTICAALTEPDSNANADDRARFESRMSGLSIDEKKAIREALKYLESEYYRTGYPDNPAQVALAGYWSNLADPSG